MIRIKTDNRGYCHELCSFMAYDEDDFPRCQMKWQDKEITTSPDVKKHLCPAITNYGFEDAPTYVILCSFDREFELVLK